MSGNNHILMHGLDAINKTHQALQLQFFWKYLSLLKEKTKFKPSASGDAKYLTKNITDYAKSADKTKLGNEDALKFSQIMSFYEGLNKLKEALKHLEFEFVSHQKLHKREHIDFANMDKHLHQAIFLEDDVIMFERMPAKQAIMQTNEHDIVGMAAFVLKAIYQELLQWNKDSPQWDLTVEHLHLADEFADKFHFNHDTKVFEDWFGGSGQEATSVRSNLNAILDEIDEQTPFKSPDYEDYYDALTFVLQKASLNNDSLMPAYHQAWEELCVFKFLAENKTSNNTKKVAWVDFGNITSFLSIMDSLKLSPTDFYQTIPETFDKESKRCEVIQKRPDFIYEEAGRYTVVDFKHYSGDQILSLLNLENLDDSPQVKQSLQSMRFYVNAVALAKGDPNCISLPPVAAQFWLPTNAEGEVKAIDGKGYSIKYLQTASVMRDYLELKDGKS
ncbi:MAG: hypothetical protein JXR42_00280 [Gammaproteobacteria bacterium]|nr:hypothetical protein [Gammaproteobacteria bacterium]